MKHQLKYINHALFKEWTIPRERPSNSGCTRIVWRARRQRKRCSRRSREHLQLPKQLESDPGLCDLSQTALKGYIANQLVEDSSLSPELLLEKEEEIKKGKEAETIICDYVDSLMSMQNPTNPDEGNWVKPVNHPCTLRFENVQNDWDTDYENIVNLVQRHTNCSTAYCLRKR